MKSKRIVIFSLFLAAAYWAFEAVLHSTIFGHGSFSHDLLPGTSHEAWTRTLTFSLFVGFGFIAQSLNDKRISAETQRSQEQFKRLMDESPEAIGIHQQGKPVYANAAALRLLGATSFDEIAGRDILAFVHPDDRDEADRRIHRILGKGERSYRIEEKLQLPNGKSFLAEVTAIPVEFNGSQAVMVVGRNIEERKRWENELQASLEKEKAAMVAAEIARKHEQDQAKLLERFFRHTHDGIVLLDREFNFVRVNQAYAEACGRDAEEFLGLNYFELYPSPLIEDFREVVATGVSFQAYARPFIFPDHPEWGETYWDLSLAPIFDADGEVELLLFTLKDVTDRRRAESRLEESERRSQLILDHAADAVTIVDNDMRCIYANEQAQRLLGYEEEELLAMTIRDITPAGETEEMLSKFGQVKAFGHLRSEIDLLRKDGSVFPAEINAVQLPDGNIFGSLRDITNRKHNEQQLAEYVSMLEDTMQGTLQAVSNMVEQRDPYTAGHERRVGTIAADIAREMGWHGEKCHDLQLIGLVHDIGKIGIPAEILSKPGRLSAMEYALVQSHVERGYEILKDVKFPLPIAEIIHQHHERMDGSGYPQGLKGEDILPEARILAVADVMESMASHRPYRPALGVAMALDEISGNRGTKFDTDVVDALLRLVHEKGYQLPA